MDGMYLEDTQKAVMFPNLLGISNDNWMKLFLVLLEIIQTELQEALYHIVQTYIVKYAFVMGRLVSTLL